MKFRKRCKTCDMVYPYHSENCPAKQLKNLYQQDMIWYREYVGTEEEMKKRNAWRIRKASLKGKNEFCITTQERR